MHAITWLYQLRRLLQDLGRTGLSFTHSPAFREVPGAAGAVEPLGGGSEGGARAILGSTG